MAFLWRVLSVSEDASQFTETTVDPMIWSLIMMGSFVAVVAVMAGFFTIVRKNKNQFK